MRALTFPAMIGMLGAQASFLPFAHGAVTYTSQNRFIRAQTSADENDQRIIAPDFSPFVRTLSLQTTFIGANGTVLPNRAIAGIDCQVDPDGVRATGSLRASGGISIIGTPEFGVAKADLRIGFHVDVPTPYTIYASPRPGLSPDDGFQVGLENSDTSATLYSIDETVPPREVRESGVLPPGNYLLKYEVEVTVSDAENGADFSFNFALGPFCHGGCVADLDDGSGSGTPDGGVTIDDLLYFVGLFESGAACADVDNGSSTGTRDGGVTIVDLLYYLERFVSGC